MTASEAPLPEDWVARAEMQLLAALGRAQALRYLDGLPHPSLGASEVLRRLSAVRVRLDEVDGLLVEVAQFRTGVRVLFKEASAQLDDRWAAHVSGNGRPRRASFGSEIDAPREKYARADLATLDDRRLSRDRERVLDASEDAYRIIEKIFRGLDSVRMDLHALLRLMSAPEHRLDRTSHE